MKTRENLRRQLQTAFEQIEFICQHGNCDDVLDTLDLAADAYARACQHGCDVPMPRLTSAHDSLRLAGQLLAWATPTPEALTVQQAADRVGVSSRTIYDLCDSGDLKHQRIGTGRGTIRIRPANLDKCNRRSEQKPGTYTLRHIG